MYSFGGVAGSVGHQQIWSAGLGYANGPFTFGAAYLNARNPNLSFYGSNPSAGTSVASMNTGSVGSATSPESNPAYAGYASASTLQIAAAGGAWRLGPVTLGATYSNVQFRGLGDTATSGPNPFGYSGTATFNVGELNIRWQLSPAFLLGTAYSYVHNGGADGRDSAIYRQGSLGADYLLSKRTDVYSIVVYQHASGTDSLNQSAVASISGQTASANNHQLAVRFGLRHRF
jgi:predicted porin